MMKDRRIVVPWFLDKPSRPAEQMAGAADRTIRAGPGTGDATERLAPIHQELASEVAQAVADGARPVAFLGDCCQAIGVLAGLARAGVSPALVWLDSHGDFNTWETSPSGFLAGMPLAMLTGRGDQRMMQAVGLQPIADQRVVLSDGRDLDPGERKLVEQSGIRHVSEVQSLAEALPPGPLYVHFDSDIIDSAAAPAFLYPVPGGPSPGEMREVLAMLQATGRVVAVSMSVTWDAAKDIGRRTEAASFEAFVGLVGKAA